MIIERVKRKKNWTNQEKYDIISDIKKGKGFGEKYDNGNC
jgi:hypothetical protein